MNIAHTKITASHGARICGFSLVRQLALCSVLAYVSLTPAKATEKDPQRAAPQQPAAQRDRLAPPPPVQRQPDAQARQFDSRQFEARAEEQRRQLQQDQNARNADAQRRSLTADELRDLRRQIKEGGNNLYPNPPRR